MLRHTLHKYPELSMREHNTVKTLMRFISENTSFKTVDCGGWFYAVKEGSDAAAGAVAFRADMDALPIHEGLDIPYASTTKGVSHKCGHDGHCAALCALALELERAKLSRTVYLIFQPAEETGLGAAICSKLISEKNITEIYAFHNLGGYEEGEIIYRNGLTQPASEGLIIKLIGKESHASDPGFGRNPAFAVSKLALYSQSLLNGDNTGFFTCTVVGIKVGSGDFGISAGYGELKLTLRAEYESDLARARETLLEYASSLAESEGLVLKSERSDSFPETKNDPKCIEKVITAAKKRGFSVKEMDNMWMASEDFGCYTKICAGAIFYIGNGRKYPALHTSEYDFNDNIIPAAADMFLELASM
ncbi:MAG: amidohydrolase [Clostridia bacterium]|nr:amidohydrolase [Clostridia bacterium]